MYHRCNRVNIQHARTFVIYKVIKETLLHKVQICFAAGNVIEHLKSLTIRLISRKKLEKLPGMFYGIYSMNMLTYGAGLKKVGLTSVADKLSGVYRY